MIWFKRLMTDILVLTHAASAAEMFVGLRSAEINQNTTQ